MVTPGARRDAVAHVCKEHDVSQRRACAILAIDRSSVRYCSLRPNDASIREAMRQVASERRRFGYRRIHVMLDRQGIVMNLKKLRRLFREEKLAVPKRGGRKRALGTRRLIALPSRANERWSLDFVSDAFTDGRRFRVLAVVDDFTRECLALVAGTSLSGPRVTRELDIVMAQRGRPHTIVSDNGTELTSMAILRWCQQTRVDGTTSHRESRCKTASWKASMAVSATSASTKHYSRHCLTPEPRSPHGRRITTGNDRIHRWAISRPTNSL